MAAKTNTIIMAKTKIMTKTNRTIARLGDRHKKVEYKWKCHTEYKKKLVKIIYKHHGKHPIKIYKWKAVKVCYRVPVHHGHGHR